MSDSDEVNEEIEQVLEGVRSGVESGTAIAENVEALANGEGGGPASIGEVTSGVGTGLDALGDGLEELGVDSQIVGAIETLGDLAPLVGAAIEGGEALVDAVHAIESALRSDRRRVEYDIDLPGGGDVHWRVSEVEVREKLGRTYAATVRIRTEQLDARPMELLGTDATLTMRRGESDSVHPIHGIVSAVGRGGEHDRQLDAIIEIVPALELMRHVRDSRIFQELSAVQIIHAAVGAHLSEYGREIRLDLEREDDHVRRECCVQYQETVLDFFHRLIEEEGLTYYFDQSGEHEVVVVVDDNSRLASAPLMPDANGAPYVPGATGNTVIGEEPVRALTASEQLGPTSLTIADFDWTADRLPFSAEQRTTDAQGRGREEYIHDRATVVAGYDESKGKYQTFDYKHRLDRGRERQAMAGLHFSGRSEVVGLYAGSLLRVVDHPELDGEYLITQVTHTRRDHNLGDDDVNAAVRERPEYENRFECIPASVQFRPRLETPKPRIAGLQTARVVGPQDEEIWVDEHGRVRIQFHWDRAGRNDEDSTCWVRVMQSWAGPGFGMVFTPRIGMEVVVSFLDGDPDRPLITGCVYNGVNYPPLALPEAATQSTIRTSTSPMRAGGFNELRFEDKESEEHIYLHAQKDLIEHVLHDHTTHVEHSQTNTVDVDQTETVGQDQTLTVKRDRTKTVEGDETVVIEGTRHSEIQVDSTDEIRGVRKEIVKSERQVTIDEKDTEWFNGGREVTVREFDNTVVSGANKNTRVSGQYNIQANEHFKIMQGGEVLYMKDEVYIESSSKVQIKSPQARVLIDGPNVQVRAVGNIELEAGQCSILMGNGTISMSARMIQLNASGSQLTLDPSAAVVTGATTARLTASSTVTVTGAIVVIN